MGPDLVFRTNQIKVLENEHSRATFFFYQKMNIFANLQFRKITIPTGYFQGFLSGMMSAISQARRVFIKRRKKWLHPVDASRPTLSN